MKKERIYDFKELPGYARYPVRPGTKVVLMDSDLKGTVCGTGEKVRIELDDGLVVAVHEGDGNFACLGKLLNLVYDSLRALPVGSLLVKFELYVAILRVPVVRQLLTDATCHKKQRQNCCCTQGK